ncbi:MAG: 3'(2'),5'-bisphosphate nucleotidase CysQ [Mariprofundaceae bacterium]
MKYLDSVIEICQHAGDSIEKIRKEGFNTSYKDGKNQQDPVTTADMAADRILSTGLTSLIPGSYYFGEEGAQGGEKGSPYCWIVDPLDGTREFVHGIPEYAVSVILQHQGKDQVAVIYNPAQKIMIAGSRRGVTLNGQPCHVSDRNLLPAAKALASRTETSAGEWDRFSDLEIITTGSVAWKCALVAAGQADLTFTLRPRHVWDVAAGFALVRWAGGIVSTQLGSDIDIRPTQDKVRCFLASNGQLHPSLLARIKDVTLGPDRRG